MDTRKAIGVIAGIVLVIGAILAFSSTSVSADVDCGSALSSKTTGAAAAEFGEALTDIYSGGDGSNATDYEARCEDRIATQRLVAFPVLGLGALVLLFLALTRQEPAAAPSVPREPAETQPPTESA